MTNLPTSSPASGSVTEKTVPAAAPRPSREWLAGRVMTFLAHFWTPDTPQMVKEAAAEDWIEVLRDLPQRAVELAIWERLRSDDRRRPIPGEIRRSARRFISYPSLPQSEGERPKLEVVTPERAAQIAAEVGGIAAQAFKPPSELAYDLIEENVCDVFGVMKTDLRSTRRNPEVCQARFAVAYLLRRHTQWSFPKIATLMGTADHTTTMHQVKRGADLAESDADFGARVDEVERRLSK